MFFFAAHLMESTVVGLELYFEHRNHLAALFLFSEVCPFALTLDSGFLGLVDADAVTTAPPSAYGTAPSPMRVESSGQFV